MSEASKRRWFSVSIRELALLVVAFGFAVAWWRERTTFRLIQQCVDNMIETKIKAPPLGAPGGMSYDFECEISGVPVWIKLEPARRSEFSEPPNDPAPYGVHFPPSKIPPAFLIL